MPLAAGLMAYWRLHRSIPTGQRAEEDRWPVLFDTLGYAKRPRDAGIPAKEAEAHAEAAREFIMIDLMTKQDLILTKQDLEVRFRGLETVMQHLETRLQNRIDNLELCLMVRLGGMLAIAVAILAAIIKF
jgi:hypothetical protein